MIDSTFIERRVERIRGYYNDINELLTLQENFPRRLYFYYAIERVIQLVVDEMIDVNNHIIAQKNFRVPDDFQSSFAILEENSVLDRDLAMRLAPIVGLRNRLVHRYESVDRELMLTMMSAEKEDIQKYVTAVETYTLPKREGI